MPLWSWNSNSLNIPLDTVVETSHSNVFDIPLNSQFVNKIENLVLIPLG